VAAGLAWFAESREPGQGMAQLALAIVCVILVNGVFSFWQTYRAEQALDALRRLLPQQVNVLRDAALQTLAAELLVPGDVLLLSEGDKVPADCRLIEAFDLRVNLSTLTGLAALGKPGQARGHPQDHGKKVGEFAAKTQPQGLTRHRLNVVRAEFKVPLGRFTGSQPAGPGFEAGQGRIDGKLCKRHDGSLCAFQRTFGRNIFLQPWFANAQKHPSQKHTVTACSLFQTGDY